MAFNVLRFCLQALIIQSLYSVVIDVSCAGLAPYAVTPWAIATSHPLVPYDAPLNPIVTPLGAAYAAPYTAPIAAPLATPYTAAPIVAAPTRPYVPTLAESNGGGLTITSLSPVPPTGVSLVSENTIKGGLAVAGEVPFLSAVTLEGALPTFGSGVVSYTCGNGEVGMLAEDFNCGYNRYGGLGYDGYAMPLGYGFDVYAPGNGYYPYTGYRMYY